MEFLEASAFTRVVYSYMDEDGQRELQARLAENPEAGALIPETGGFRKLRVEDPRRGKGKRGGLRLIYYYYFEEDARIWMVTVYDKHEATDLIYYFVKLSRAAVV